MSQVLKTCMKKPKGRGLYNKKKNKRYFQWWFQARRKQKSKLKFMKFYNQQMFLNCWLLFWWLFVNKNNQRYLIELISFMALKLKKNWKDSMNNSAVLNTFCPLDPAVLNAFCSKYFLSSGPKWFIMYRKIYQNITESI